MDYVESDPAAELKKQADKADLEAAMYTGNSEGAVCSEAMEDASAPCPGNGLGAQAEPSMPFPPGSWSKAAVPEEAAVRTPFPPGSWSKATSSLEVAVNDAPCPGNGLGASETAGDKRWIDEPMSNESIPRAYSLISKLSPAMKAEPGVCARLFSSLAPPFADFETGVKCCHRQRGGA